jgi:hypothetical protein
MSNVDEDSEQRSALDLPLHCQHELQLRMLLELQRSLLFLSEASDRKFCASSVQLHPPKSCCCLLLTQALQALAVSAVFQQAHLSGSMREQPAVAVDAPQLSAPTLPIEQPSAGWP